MIALIDYGMGNLRSVHKALEYVGGRVTLTDAPADVTRADGVILPGVGNFGDGMEHLRSRGLADAVVRAIAAGKPFLGICLGMQMLLDSSEEAPGVAGLGVFRGRVVRFPEGREKVPHMGWNSITVKQSCRCLEQVADGTFFYFVHSFYAAPEDPSVVAASCSYMVDFAAALGRDNIFATQFHPEKSQNGGLAILRSFVGSVGDAAPKQ
ncbi:MAG: imidazole glycerol phosphate synthase subunit HisH [Victivallales bacterium]|nr:imidazole glycerol phosphate synthase subunit HisH [Victivallales bacterium]